MAQTDFVVVALEAKQFDGGSGGPEFIPRREKVYFLLQTFVTVNCYENVPVI